MARPRTDSKTSGVLGLASDSDSHLFSVLSQPQTTTPPPGILCDSAVCNVKESKTDSNNLGHFACLREKDHIFTMLFVYNGQNFKIFIEVDKYLFWR